MRTRPLLAALGGALAVGVAVATSSLSPATADVTLPPIIPAPTSATITLVTNSDTTGRGFINYADSSGNSAQQVLDTASSSSCTLVPSGDTVLTFSGTARTTSTVSAPVGFAKTTSAGSIGVNAQNGTACSQVNYSSKTSAPSEALTVSVPQTLTVKKPNNGGTTTVTGLKAVSAVFDVESKGSVVVRADFYAGGTSGAPVYTRWLYTGAAVVPSGSASISDKCDKTGKDTGPDSGSGDNCRWAVTPSAAFTDVVLTPTAGASVALEGGGDWADASANRTVLTLTDGEGILFCDQTTDTVTSADGTTSITVQRLANGDGSTCIKIPYNLDAQDNVCQFTKPLDLQPTAQFLLTCVRTIQAAVSQLTANDYSGGGNVVAAPAPSLEVLWPDGSTTGIPLTFCPGELWAPGSTPEWNYTWLSSHRNDAALATDMSGPLSGLQYACVKSETAETLNSTTATPIADGSVRVTDVVYLTGDILLTTKR